MGLRWTLLEDHNRFSGARRAGLDALLANLTTKPTAHAWQYREDLREILDRKQINVVREMLKQWCTDVMRSTVERMKAVSRMIRSHLKDIVAWAQTRMTNGFLEALKSVCQAAKREAGGYRRLSTIRTIIILIVGKLDFRTLDPHAV